MWNTALKVLLASQIATMTIQVPRDISCISRTRNSTTFEQFLRGNLRGARSHANARNSTRVPKVSVRLVRFSNRKEGATYTNVKVSRQTKPVSFFIHVRSW